MTAPAPLQPEPVNCKCGHPYESHGSSLLGCMFGLSQTPEGIKWGCDCPDFKLANNDEPPHQSGCICADCTVPDSDEQFVQTALDAERPDPSCRCGSPLSAHGEAGCTEVVGRDSPDERGRNVYCDCDGFRGAK